jgi:transaldolase
MEDVDKAHEVLEKLAKAGVDYDDVTETLELEGVQKFADSFTELLDGVRAKRGQLAAV